MYGLLFGNVFLEYNIIFKTRCAAGCVLSMIEQAMKRPNSEPKSNSEVLQPTSIKNNGKVCSVSSLVPNSFTFTSVPLLIEGEYLLHIRRG